jgi:hypothetical protein
MRFILKLLLRERLKSLSAGGLAIDFSGRFCEKTIKPG